MKKIKFITFVGISILFIVIIINSIQHIRAEVLYRNGYIKSQRGYPKLAIKDFKTSSELMPWETHYRLQLAQNYEQTANQFSSEYDEFILLAIKEYEKLILADPLNPWFKARLGLIYHALNRKYPGVDEYKKRAYELAKGATTNDPQNPLFTLHFAHFLYTYDMTEEAKKYYQKTINYDNDITEAHFNLGGIFLKQNNISEAIKHYEVVNKQLTKSEKYLSARTPQDKRNKLERFQKARIILADEYLNQSKTFKAFDLIKQIPASIEKFELLAKYYEKTARINDAIKIYKDLNDKLDTTKYNENIQRLINE
tara:strand:+ start:2498 stop:3430 length:933 start_codon:yes stop_codon:yes gene_type:complete